VLTDLQNSPGDAIPCDMGGSLICGEPFTNPFLKAWKSISQAIRDAFSVYYAILLKWINKEMGL